MVSWLGGAILGLAGFIGIAVLAKYTGLFDLFGMLWSFVRVLIDFFVHNIPKPIKIILFLLVFVLMGSFIYSWSFGLQYVCDTNDNVFKGETIFDGAKVKLFEMFATESVSEGGTNYSFKVVMETDDGHPAYLNAHEVSEEGKILTVLVDKDDGGDIDSNRILEKNVKLYFCRNEENDGCELRVKDGSRCEDGEDVVGNIEYKYEEPNIPSEKGTFTLTLNDHWRIFTGPELETCQPSEEHEEVYGSPYDLNVEYYGWKANAFTTAGEYNRNETSKYVVKVYNSVFKQFLNYEEGGENLPADSYLAQQNVKVQQFSKVERTGDELMWNECKNGDLHLIVAGIDMFDKNMVFMMFLVGILLMVYFKVKH